MQLPWSGLSFRFLVGHTAKESFSLSALKTLQWRLPNRIQGDGWFAGSDNHSSVLKIYWPYQRCFLWRLRPDGSCQGLADLREGGNPSNSSTYPKSSAWKITSQLVILTVQLCKFRPCHPSGFDTSLASLLSTFPWLPELPVRYCTSRVEPAIQPKRYGNTYATR